MLLITFSSENSQIGQETVKFGAAKSTEIINILDLFRNAGVSNFLLNFNVFIKNITKSMSFFSKKHRLTLNINVRKKKK